MDAYAVTVFLSLAKHSDSEGTCFPTMETIAKTARCSKPTVIKALKALEVAGYIQVKRRKTQNGNAVNVYTIFEVVSPSKPGLPAKSTSFTPPSKPGLPELEPFELEPSNKISRAEPSMREPSKAELDLKASMLRIESAYFVGYKSLHDKGKLETEKPVIYPFGQNRTLIKTRLKEVPEDVILSAIETAEGETFIIKSGFLLATILSANVLAGLAAKRAPRREDKTPCVNDTEDWTSELVARERGRRET